MSQSQDTEVSSIASLVAACRATFNSGTTLPLSWRKAQLNAIIAMVSENRSAIHAAVQADLGKPLFEADVHEVEMVLQETRHTLAHVSSWAAPQAAHTPLMYLPASTYIYHDPLGVALILTPWNFPFYLGLNSIVAAVGAGNAVVFKPSELAPASEALLADLIARYLDPAAIKVVRGGVAQATALLDQRFDVIMYTGGPAVARAVMAKAARHLTPVLLELGGKNPVIVDASADLDLAASAIVRGRFVNCGQMCIAPEYVLVEASVEEALLERLRAATARMFGADPRASSSYGRMVNARHWKRVMGLLEGAGGTCITGERGQGSDAGALYIPPTIIREPSQGAPLWGEEVFGPVLATRRVASVEEAIGIVNAGDKPLCLYMFSGSPSAIASVLGRTSSGGVTVNDTLLHMTNSELPFGGVGVSGMGAYHGKHGFEAFSHRKPVHRAYSWFNVIGLFMNPPYYVGQERVLGLLLRYVPTHLLPLSIRDSLLVGLVAAVVGMGLRLTGRI